MTEKFGKRFAGITAYNFVNVLFPLAFLLTVVYNYGLKEWGVIAVAQAISIITLVLIDFGMQNSLIQRINKNHSNLNLLKLFISLKIILFIIFGSGAIIVNEILSLANRSILCLLLIHSFATALTPIWYANYFGLNSICATINLGYKSIITIFFLLLSLSMNKIASDFIVMVYVNTTFAVATHITIKMYLHCKKDLRESKNIDAFEIITFSLPFLLNRVSQVLGTSLPLVLLSAKMTPIEIGIFSLYDKLIAISKISVQPLSEICYAINIKYNALRFDLISTKTKVFHICLAIITIIIFILLKTQVISTSFLTEIRVHAEISTYAMATIIAAIISMMTGYPLLSPLGLNRLVPLSSTVGALTSISYALIKLHTSEQITAEHIVITLLLYETITLSSRVTIYIIGRKDVGVR